MCVAWPFLQGVGLGLQRDLVHLTHACRLEAPEWLQSPYSSGDLQPVSLMLVPYFSQVFPVDPCV